MQPYYVPDFLIKIQGVTLEADVTSAVISLSFESILDAADMFTLQINNADLRYTNSELFQVGQTVEIYMGYVGDLQPMMLGEITAISPSFPQSGASTLSITGYDKSYRLRHNRPLRPPLLSLNASAIAAQIAVENLLVPIVDPTPLKSRGSTHRTGTDWQILQELADRTGFWTYVYWDKLYFRFPRPQTDLVVLEWGKNLSSFTPRMSTAGLAGIQVIRGYNDSTKQEILAVLPALSLGSDIDDTLSRLSSASIDYLVQLGRNVISEDTVESFSDALVVAKAALVRLLQGLYEGSGSCIGIPTLRARDTIEIRGIGKRFSGKYTLSQVTHTIDEGGYTTQFQVSQKYTTTLLQSLHHKIKESPSPTHQDKIEHVLIGKVKANVDPEGLGRVLLSFPHLAPTNLIWARVATLTAGLKRGAYFLPEINDEVLVAFERGDVNKPIVVGSLWSQVAPPPANSRVPNLKKMIQTTSGMKIMFDDTPGANSLSLETQTGHEITLNNTTGAEQVVIKHLNGSTVELLADNTLRISASGNMTLEATGDLALKANGNVNIEGASVAVKATSNVDIEGTVAVTGTLDVS